MGKLKGADLGLIKEYVRIPSRKLAFKVKVSSFESKYQFEKIRYYFVVNTSKKRNASSFLKALKKSDVLLFRVGTDYLGNKYMNSPIIPLSDEEYYHFLENVYDFEKVIKEFAATYEGEIDYDSKYAYGDFFRVYFIRFGDFSYRVGCPYFIKNRAVWIHCHYKGRDITEYTNVKTKTKRGRAPKYRIYHNNSQAPKKLLEVLEYYRRKALGIL